VLRAVVGLAGLLLLAMFAVPTVKAVRRYARRRRSDPTRRLAGAWQDTVDRLRDAGIRTTRCDTTGEVVTAADCLNPTITAAVANLAHLHDVSAFAPVPTTTSAAHLAWTTADEIRRRIRKDLPASRRLRATVTIYARSRPRHPGRRGDGRVHAR
jgi:hypothetical protein